MAFDDLVDRLDRARKRFEPFRIVPAGADRDDHRGAESDRLGRDQRHPTTDHAEVLQPADAAPAGVGGQADLITDRRD